MIQSESSLLAEKAKLKLMTDELKLIENELQTNGLQFWIFKEVMHFVIWKKV